MNKDLVIFCTSLILFLMLLFTGINYMSQIQCETRWEDSEFRSKYSFNTGCLIEVSKNKWIPEINYRKFAE
jgi:hypothetical protein